MYDAHVFVVDDDRGQGHKVSSQAGGTRSCGGDCHILEAEYSDRSGKPPVSIPFQRIFDRQRHTHTAADAERGQAAAHFSLQHFVEQRHRNARSGAADGMAERDSATVDVEFLALEMQLAVACQYLGSECLIEFDQIEVAELEAVFPLHFADGRHWP